MRSIQDRTTRQRQLRLPRREAANNVSLNPALEDIAFCPRCGAAATVRFPRSLHCESCGYAAFYNPKPVGCAIAREPDGRVWLARRGHEPGKGRWSMPGGFVDLGETVETAIARELEEELCVGAQIGSLVGVYSRAEERVVVIVFEAELAGAPVPTDEAPEVAAFAPDAIPWDELAFWTDTAALRDVLREA
jgi:ADP-ribose pyrophosphatase YjhB (NUDIX family)